MVVVDAADRNAGVAWNSWPRSAVGDSGGLHAGFEDRVAACVVFVGAVWIVVSQTEVDGGDVASSSSRPARTDPSSNSWRLRCRASPDRRCSDVRSESQPCRRRSSRMRPVRRQCSGPSCWHKRRRRSRSRGVCCTSFSR
jgi:hypothetical protein